MDQVLITGGSQGIGLEVAKEFIRKGANVTIVARNPHAALDELKGLSISPLQKIQSVAVDIASGMEEVAKAFQPVLKEVGDVHTIVNSAGITCPKEFHLIPQSAFENLLKVNVLGTIYATRAVLDGMKRNREGRIVFVSSQVAHCAIYGYTGYAASKWALRGLAEALQMEVRPYDIYVSVSYPPDTDTPGFKVENEDKPELTKKLSESGVFHPKDIARDICNYSAKGYFTITHGFDGWLLKCLHPGMSPVNNAWEVTQQLLMSGIARVISVFYILPWDTLIAKEHAKMDALNHISSSSKSSKKETKTKKA